MLARLRATAAAALLAGLFVLAALLLGALVAVVAWVARTGSPLGVVVGVVVTVVVVPLVLALVRILRSTPVAPDGMPVPLMAEPELWALVSKTAEGVGTRAPDEIRLVVDAVVGVTEDSRSLGLGAGTRTLHIGVPLLQTLTRAELVWVLGHELGHHSQRHVALSGLSRRGLLALVEVTDGLGPRHVLGWLFRAHLAVYSRVVRALWRGQELDADRWAAELSGRLAGVSALRATAVTAATWATFDRDYGSIGTAAGMVPRGLFPGYASFLSDPEVEQVDAGRIVADERPSPLDTHPPTATRIARIEQFTADVDTPAGDDPALLLLVDPSAAIGRVEAHHARAGGLAPVTWEKAVLFGNRRRDEERAVALRAAADAITTGAVDLSVVLRLVGSERAPELAAALGGEGEATEATLVEALGALVRTALVSAGHTTHALRWNRTDVIVDETGTEVDVAELVQGVVGVPRQAEWLLKVLRAEGISGTWNPVVSSVVIGPTGPQVLSVLVVRQKLRWSPRVVHVTEAGLVVRRIGLRELVAIPPLGRRTDPQQVLARSVRTSGLALLSDPEATVVPWDAVEHVEHVDGDPARLVVRREGRATSYRVEAVAGDVVEALTARDRGQDSGEVPDQASGESRDRESEQQEVADDRAGREPSQVVHRDARTQAG
ncbi:Zn-dependent protease with chaperone function [Nocardioides exalbidus]|uniref:Zn-dependent protease with chaperone function n=1 Tax=Nocardioides exalbidus TaxID=402596 RepID=A0A1H4LII6_9ACTN|nr:M48 family metallopeptidase [Nocardioides exalbidus]SEB70550.1 Zn-dependent protease with chaperone function [Nocardioides exalbidus]